MKKTISILALVALVIVAYSCKKNADSTPLKTVSLVLPAQTEAFYGNASPAFDSINKIATLGKVLFYDPQLSINNSISCGSCHKQALGFADNVAFSKGFEGKLTARNSIGIHNLNSSLFVFPGQSGGNLFWDGRENNVNNLAIRPLTNHVEMGINDPNALPEKLATLPYYKNLFVKAYGDNQITVNRISDAIALFIGAINSKGSRFDQAMNGFGGTELTAQETQGMNLFNTKYQCGSCHNGGGGYSGSSSQFKDIGLDASYKDAGRGTITGNPADRGTFKVPNLHNVALTAPYMHDGRFKTLDEVLEHYSHGIQSTPNLDTLLKDGKGKARVMNISATEKQALIAFLNTLTDNTTIADPKFSNPFKAN